MVLSNSIRSEFKAVPADKDSKAGMKQQSKNKIRRNFLMLQMYNFLLSFQNFFRDSLGDIPNCLLKLFEK